MGSVAILEAVILVFLSLPLPHALRKRTVWVVENSLQPMLAIVPFAIFQLTEVYLKWEARMRCAGEVCTVADKDRFDKAMMKTQRNGVLAFSALLLYWILFRFCKTLKKLSLMEDKLRVQKDE
ncbi:hypothetical protein KFL_001300210 [Klebsormidium nitens]|uniref:Endoplasmic reticulum transmembrane protein n=1 Tax=Klebsormidium nitens TaxID=105231 RepID=A0A1Y1I4C5_KLENI|nr:hypothetical protein KFL_001300210 [Klebsormidium nitens]|eukprot:GAQ82958.1 hypothetical protein KFL_001300210 [Klebsormidium nitens]